jgi:sugar (pentulose or hexulose) kinase
VLNTGGISLEWFHFVFCRELTDTQFFEDYVPSVLQDFLGSENIDQLDENIPPYVPFLQGSRYSVEKKTASFSNLTLETTREDMLLGLLKGNALYHRGNIEEVGRLVPLGHRIMTSGGASKIENFLAAKKHWTGDFELTYQDQSSLLGAAMLGQFHITGRYEDEEEPVIRAIAAPSPAA